MFEVFQTSYPEAYKFQFAKAGFLACSLSGAFPSRVLGTVAKGCRQVGPDKVPEVTAAGTAQDSHLIPYYTVMQ